MQELQLISVGDVISGGTTKPFNAIALNSEGIADRYIVKAFTKRQIKQNASVAKEILVCELAKMFDINCSDYGIMNFTKNDISGIYPPDRIAELDEGTKFCSNFAHQYAIFTPATSKAYLKGYEVVNIFAFDLFIHNLDRGGPHNKPNLLINDDELMIIDHELSMPWAVNQPSKSYENYLGMYQFQRHILLKYVRAIKIKENVLDEFCINLNELNLNKLESVFNDFDKYKIAHFDRENFMTYFAWAKRNVAIFERYLKGMI